MSVPRHRMDETGLTFDTAVPMFAASPALEIVLWNDAAEALLGFRRGEVLGRRCFEVLGCPEATRRFCCSDRGDRPCHGSGDLAPVFEGEIATKPGERLWVTVTTLLAGPGGGPRLRVHLLREIGRERQLEELLRQVVSTASKLGPSAQGCDGEVARAAPSLRNVTTREREVFDLLARGGSTAEIAARLGIAPRTARNHIQNILGKLRVHSRLEAVAYASARGLV